MLPIKSTDNHLRTQSQLKYLKSLLKYRVSVGKEDTAEDILHLVKQD